MATDFRFKALSQFVSKDETRNALVNVYSDGGHLIATDGHRLFTLRYEVPSGFYVPAMVAKRTFARVDTEAEFPTYKQVLPLGEPSFIGEIQIPAWTARLNKDLCPLALMESGVVIAGCCKDALVQIDARLLSPLADQTTHIAVFDEHSPVVLTPQSYLSEGIMAQDWFALIMPFRASDADSMMSSPFKRIAKKDAA